ncbi:MAG: hypothetical protein Q4E13_00790 [Clostridia bacterium]|nr:hypothetical protein [Clostridia bacterium]
MILAFSRKQTAWIAEKMHFFDVKCPEIREISGGSPSRRAMERFHRAGLNVKKYPRLNKNHVKSARVGEKTVVIRRFK